MLQFNQPINVFSFHIKEIQQLFFTPTHSGSFARKPILYLVSRDFCTLPMKETKEKVDELINVLNPYTRHDPYKHTAFTHTQFGRLNGHLDIRHCQKLLPSNKLPNRTPTVRQELKNRGEELLEYHRIRGGEIVTKAPQLVKLRRNIGASVLY